MSEHRNRRNLSATTLLLNADRGLSDEASVSPPLHQSSIGIAGDAEHFYDLAATTMNDGFYARYGNPTSSRLAKVIADLEGGEAGMMFSSGVGAISTALMALTSAGDHIVAQNSHYMGTTELVTNVLAKFGVDYTTVDQTSVEAFEAAIQPNTRMILLETPVNPTMHITDLQAVCDIAKSKGIITFCDNTFATPINQRPMEFGVDIVMHSATKYIGGHHDLLAGNLTSSRELIEKIWDMSLNTGAICAPFNAWLALRGIRTMELRVRQQNANAMAVAEFLENHPAIAKVYFPGLKSHPQHDLAARQMSDFGGLLTFELKGGYEAGTAFIQGLEFVQNAGSLGGVFSVVIQPAVMFGGRLTPEQVKEQGITPGLIRLACGIENTGDLIADIDQALERLLV
jgi:cystathionine beta-lyase/cystathionine gamma-synthase